MTKQSIHEYNLLPNDAIFQRLIECGNELDRTAFNDSDYNVTANHRRLIRDVIETRKMIHNTLLPASFDNYGLLQQDNIFVCLLAPSGYEFVVASLAILSVGGAVVPLATSILPEEALHFFQQCRSTLLLAGSREVENAFSWQEYAHSHGCQMVTVLPIERTNDSSPFIPGINKDLVIPSSRPGLIVFTSGSTGPPKGVISPRACFYPGPLRREGGWICPVHRPAHWAGGVVPLIHMALDGTEMDFIPRGSTARAIWERIRQKRVAILAVNPGMLVKLKTFFERELCALPPKIRKEYVDSVRHIRTFRVGSAMPAPSTMEFWQELWGRPFQIAYASTEAGAIVSITPFGSSLKSSIGKPLPGTQIKLSEGDRGEILLKSPTMLLGYLNDEEATRAVIDSDGFYHTGDLAHLEGDEYIFDGRASSDFFRSNGYKIPILEVEHSLMSLDYVAEAYIVPIPGAALGSQVAALIKVPFGLDKSTVSLRRVREDLSRTLPAYMLPTVVLVLPAEHVLPESSSGKMVKRTLLCQYFDEGAQHGYNIETCSVESNMNMASHRPWDWAGLYLKISE